MPVLNKCCCCCQLRTGVTILGWFGLVSSMFDTAGVGAAYANIDRILKEADPEIISMANTILPILITYAVMSLLIYILMVWGSSTGNRFFLLPWLIVNMISIVIMGLGVFVGGIICLSINWDNQFLGAIIFIVGLPAFGLKLYFWLCVLSCFQEIRDSPTTEQNVLMELPKPVENIITYYRPTQYERLEKEP